jgi:hypothetical protein
MVLFLEQQIDDNMALNSRSHQVNVDRVMGSAESADLVVFTGENTESEGDGCS